MKKILLSIVVMTISLASFAVPAKRGFHEYQQPDGSTITLQLAGDEFAHWFEAPDGTTYSKNAEGAFVPVTRATLDGRRKASLKFKTAQARRARMDFGKTPNPAPRGIVILANFKDSKMQSSHTTETFTELCNAEICTVNGGYPSASQYFVDQSNGAYHPVFDVFGPVTLSNNCSYYGKNDSEGQDEYATDAVIEACILANSQNSDLNFKDYDSDNDGYVDFIYVIYAGKGEADGGAETTIWPHNWSIQDLVNNYPSYTKYKKSQTRIDGVYLDNYAMSSELSGNTLGGIGTLCHEFGHVIGLPDFYETDYGNNYKNALTPNDWDVMDGGAYNGDGHCPPNYSPWEKYFFGWHTPVNLGVDGKVLELKANGTEGYQAYQINKTGVQQTATTSGECFYIENRQQQGWDEGLPYHGMLIWKVNYNATAWANNAPNNDKTTGSPLYTVVSAYGTKIGTHPNSSQSGYVDDGPNNPFPGKRKVTSVTVADKPLTNIKEANGVISLIYIEEPTEQVEPFDLVWMSQGKQFATTSSTGKIVLPANVPDALADGKEFVGWCATADYSSETTAPEFVQAGQPAQEGDVFYAVFAATSASGSSVETTTYTFTSKDWEDITNSWKSSQEAYQFNTSNSGVQVTVNTTGAGAASNEPFDNVTKIVITYCTNAQKGVGSVTVTVGATEIVENVTKQGGTSMRELEYLFNNISGTISFTVTCTTNSIYIQSITVTAGAGTSYSGYATGTGDQTALSNTANDQVKAVKTVRNGQVVIIRGGEIYNLLGVKL